jgi:hemolysin activation/secretion protein
MESRETMIQNEFGGRRAPTTVLLAAILAGAITASFTLCGAEIAGGEPILPGADNIKAILVVPRAQDVAPAGVAGVHGIEVRGPEFLNHDDFKKLLSHYLGTSLTKESLDRMQVDIIKYCRARGHLVVDAFLREQDILEGTIQVAVIEGKVGKVTVENPGHKWFSDELILHGVRLKPGDAVIEDRLNDDLGWLNRNTYQSLGNFNGAFREVGASFTQGGLGETDVKLTVNDRFPLRVFGGYEDSGISEIGKERLFGGFTWANVFGWDHRISYQYTTDTDFNKFKSHSASYVVPLPWKHEFVLFGAYADVHPDFSQVDPNLAGFTSPGKLYQLSARYNVPLPRYGDFEHEFSLGFDFKRTDSPVLFGAQQVPGQTNLIAVAQFTADYRIRYKDRFGRSGLLLQGFFSPGDLVDHNDDASYAALTPGAKSRYLYGRAEAQRETPLPFGCSWLIRGAGQYADGTLVPSETFGLGGYTTVRGYDERTVIGDYGWLVSNELRTPMFGLGNLTRQENQHDWIQALGFVDYGGVITRNPLAAQRYGEVLLSAGAGVRFQMAENLHVRFDYGFQLTDEYKSAPGVPQQNSKRGHVGVELSF